MKRRHQHGLVLPSHEHDTYSIEEPYLKTHHMMMYLTLTLLSSHPCNWLQVFHQKDMQSATPREMSTQAGSVRVSKILIHPIKVSWSVAPALGVGFPSSTTILEKCLFMNDDILIPCAELPWDFCGVCKVYNKRCRGTAVWFDRSHGILDLVVTGWQTILCYWRRNQACYHSTWGSKGRLSRFRTALSSAIWVAC